MNKKFNRAEMTNERGTVYAGRFSDFLIEEYNIVRIDGVLNLYKDGAYVKDNDDIERTMLRFFPEISSSKRMEVMKQIDLKAPDYSGSENHDNLIVFNNGIYDIIKKKLMPCSKDYVLPNRIPWDYNPDAYCKDLDNLLDRVSDHDPEIRALIEEMWGCCLKRSPDNVAFFLVGGASNGKSTIQSIGIKMLGRQNVSSTDLRAFSTDKFASADLYGKIANISDDISGEYISDPSMFKSLTTGEYIRAQRKFGQPFDFAPYSTMVFSANRIPRVKDADGGVRRRMKIIPFKHVFSSKDKDYDPGIKNRILYGTDDCSAEEAMSYFINIALAGLDRVMNQGFTESQHVNSAVEEYDHECNPILDWCDEYLESHEDFLGESRADVYFNYTLWADHAGQKAMSQRAFSTFLCEKYDLVVKARWCNGKTARAFSIKEL